MQADWRPFFWEPVEGTGERLMAGVVLSFNGQLTAKRMLRDDVLDCLYGKAAANPKRLIDEALDTYLTIARERGFSVLAEMSDCVMGLHPGRARTTDALSVGDAMRHAVLMHASVAQLDGWDELEESDSPAAEEVNKRFATEVREAVVAERPDLARNFSRTARLIYGGRLVRFGYLSEKAVIHFSVLHPVRQAASVRDARARLWELQRARDTAGLQHAGLITWVPMEQNDVTLGEKQRHELHENRTEIEREAAESQIDFRPVESAHQARDQLLSIAA
jgi:hypothetical protein